MGSSVPCIVLVASLATGCVARSHGAEPAPPPAPPPPCHTSIVLQLKDRSPQPIPAQVLADLARSARVNLSHLRTVGSGFQILELTSDEPDAQCPAALARLRADPRVGSVDLDQRRSPHAQ